MHRLKLGKQMERDMKEAKISTGAIANAQDSGRSACDFNGHAYGVLGEPWVETEDFPYQTQTTTHFKYIAIVRYTLFCPKCGHTFEYVQHRRKPIND